MAAPAHKILMGQEFQASLTIVSCSNIGERPGICPPADHPRIGNALTAYTLHSLYLGEWGCGSNMNIDELSASVFPGIDEAKFNEWKTLRIKQRRQYRLAASLLAPVVLVPRFFVLTESLVSTLIRIAIVLPIPVALMVLLSALRKSKHINQIDKEIRITELLRAKKKGESFAR